MVWNNFFLFAARNEKHASPSKLPTWHSICERTLPNQKHQNQLWCNSRYQTKSIKIWTASQPHPLSQACFWSQYLKLSPAKCLGHSKPRETRRFTTGPTLCSCGREKGETPGFILHRKSTIWTNYSSKYWRTTRSGDPKHQSRHMCQVNVGPWILLFNKREHQCPLDRLRADYWSTASIFIFSKEKIAQSWTAKEEKKANGSTSFPCFYM